MNQIKETKIFENTLEVPAVNFPFREKQPPKPPHKDWILISGIATSQVRSRSSSDVPAMIFLRINDNKHALKECANSECKRCEIPIIFRIKKEGKYFKPKINKGDNLELAGYFADTDKPRPSFTCYSYEVITKHE